MVGHDARDRIHGIDMLLINATDASSNETLLLVHEVKNQGKITEEHYFYAYPQGSSIHGKPLFAFVTGPDQAKELKSHL
jgi:hypothetical protein